jgi:1L-myo-inositol 1-phosphate cytidylyltransferase/CDP-L-myo-inositol myo-inositolphosphotransferase
MKGVILAAGRGSRISKQNGHGSKVLLQVEDKPLIDYALRAFEEAGVSDVAVVVGHEADAVMDWVGDGARYRLDIQFIFNPDYPYGNARSVYAARPFVGRDSFLLAMADHLMAPGLLKELVAQRSDDNFIAIDRRGYGKDIDECTRVWTDSAGLVTRIGKNVTPWNGIDAGAFRLTPAIFEALDEVIGEDGVEYELSRAITLMIELGHPLQACDISGWFWQDIDTLDDLTSVRNTLVGTASWPNRRKA